MPSMARIQRSRRQHNDRQEFHLASCLKIGDHFSPYGRGPKDEEALKEEHIKTLKQKIGDLVVANDVLRRP